MLRRLIFVALALAATTPPSIAGEAMIGTVSINLPPPPGFCDMADTDPDKSLVKNLTDLSATQGVKLLKMSADCQQLAAWRTGTGKLLDDFLQYQTPAALIDTQVSGPPEETTKRSCAELRAQGEKALADRLPGMKANVENIIKEVKLNETTFAGVLAEEPNACYAALISKIRTALGTDKTQVTLIALTIIKGKNVYMYRTAVNLTPDTINAVLAKSKIDLAALLAANRN